jgi:hypothetical protein
MATDLLIGMDAICNAFEISKKQFYMFCSIGMPVSRINGRIFGHRIIIDNFFRMVTNKQNITIDENKVFQAEIVFKDSD